MGEHQDSRLAHWPHATEWCKARLDLDRIEPLAVRLLARALLSQRLVAFVGAGASAAYGRMTWRGLMEVLWRRIDQNTSHAEDANDRQAIEVWTQIRTLLWNDSIDQYLGYGDHALKAQVLANVLDLMGSGPFVDDNGAKPLQTQTRHALENFHGFVEELVSRVAPIPAPAVATPVKTMRQVRIDLENELKQAPPAPALAPAARGLPAVTSALHAYALNDKTQTAEELRRTLISALCVQSTGVDSPLRLLWHEWGIRRYVTTNYDHEIERSLLAAGFVASVPGKGEVLASQVESLGFDRRSTGDALRFALEGPRRHAAVLHLHGDVDDTRSIIVTESDYQRLYLDDHPQRDLVNNATMANFAANPMFFVGSDVSEDDVLRPMRQFMSGQGHRSDRMSVALFVTNKTPHERARRRAELWLKYGVFAIDIGRADIVPPAQDGDAETLWLVRLLQVQEKYVKALADDAKSADRKSAVALLNQMASTPPKVLEGVQCSEYLSLDLSASLRTLNEVLSHAEDEPTCRKLAAEVFKITCSHASSCFLCAKLISLRRAATEAIESDARIAVPFARARLKDSADSLLMNRRHGVRLSHPLWHGRFECSHEQDASGEAFGENIDKLCEAIGSKHGFSSDRRRVLIVCAARGHGKGAQFDHLVAANGAGAQPHLQALLKSLQGYEKSEHSRVVHVNLSFSNELGSVISLVIDVMQSMAAEGAESTSAAKDQIEMLGRALQGLCASSTKGRLLLVLGNAGVLFDARGKPKNGQIIRVMRALLSPRFARARLDILMYVGESQMPEYQRISGTEPDPAKEPAEPWIRFSSPGKDPIEDTRLRRRLHRLNIEASTTGRRILVHPLPKTRVSDLARAYFPELAQRVGWNAHTEANDEPARSLYFATGGSRLAQTLLLAWLDTATAVPNNAGMAHLVSEACAALRVTPASSAVEACVAFVLDRWSAWHRLGDTEMPKPCRVRRKAPGPVVMVSGDAMHAALEALGSPMSPEGWTVANELLWHLSAFGHPVERCVLLACPRVLRAATALAQTPPLKAVASTEDLCVAASLELLVHRCLLFRIDPRPLPASLVPAELELQRIRYAPHRHIQRHFVQLMGGRNIEVTAWDQFTTTLYASLPDEAPVLRPEVHSTLVEVVQRLTRYPEPKARLQDLEPREDTTRTDALSMVERVDQIRAAYYLVRSTYSLGVVSHLTADAPERVTPLGHLERYRRLVRWITREARAWEDDYGIRTEGEPSPNAIAWRDGGKPSGIFYPGELIWLYNECGVISLAQGKLQDAEQLLTMAEVAARQVEADDSGSLHTRIRIHSALVQIERGRPQRARQILQPIAERRNGHPVPPLLARFYLGMVEHLGGSYALAQKLYDEALKGLRTEGRSRAEAFVRMHQADVQFSLDKHALHTALSTADEAISLAQQGGHEDLRVMATLSRARICIDADQISGENLFEHLSFAQRYSVRMDIPRLASEVHELRARLLMRQGEYHLSAKDATAGLEISAMYDLKLRKARGLLTLAEIYHHRGEAEGARKLVGMGREIAASCDYYACVRGFKELEVQMSAHPKARS